MDTKDKDTTMDTKTTAENPARNTPGTFTEHLEHCRKDAKRLLGEFEVLARRGKKGKNYAEWLERKNHLCDSAFDYAQCAEALKARVQRYLHRT